MVMIYLVELLFRLVQQIFHTLHREFDRSVWLLMFEIINYDKQHLSNVDVVQAFFDRQEIVHYQNQYHLQDYNVQQQQILDEIHSS